jgi:hypothetical protein
MSWDLLLIFEAHTFVELVSSTTGDESSYTFAIMTEYWRCPHIIVKMLWIFTT